MHPSLDIAIHDPARLAALRETGLLDSPPEDSFDRVTRLATRFLDAPAGLVSLVDDRRQFFKSCIGLAEPWAGLRETPLSHSICKHVLIRNGPLVVQDAREDPLVRQSLAIEDLGVVAYLGVPLMGVDGHCLGSFCVVDGRPRDWTEVEVASMVDLAASVTTEIALRADLLKRSRQNEQLRLFQSAVEGANDAIVITEAEPLDPPGPRIVYVNQAFTRMTGYTAEEVIGQAPRRLQGPGTDREAVADIRSRLGRWKEVRTELLNYRKDGGEFWVEMVIRPLADERGWYTHWVSIQRDVTERRKVEEALRRSESEARRLALVASRTSNAVIICDPAGRILWVNESFTRITGYELGEVAGRSPGSVLQGPETDRETDELMRRCIRAGEGFRVEVQNRGKHGRSYWLDIEVQPIRDGRGTLTHFIAIESDITERKAVEGEMRRARAEAEAASLAKSQFLANMSHEIRTPMNGVLGMTELLLSTELSAEQGEYLGIVKSSGESLLSLLNDILDLSKVETGKMGLEPIEFLLDDVLTPALKPFGAVAAAKGVDFCCRVMPDVPGCLVGDPGRVRQVIINLVNNAIKFTAEGRVLVTIGRLPCEPGGVRLAVTVADTGIGIPAEKLRAIFEPFTQADGSTTRRFGGAGLGLSIAARLAGLMGGEIAVESEPGVGSTFRFEASLGEGRPDPDRCRLGELAGLVAVVASTDPDRRASLADSLRAAGMRIACLDDPGVLPPRLLRALAEGAPAAVAIIDDGPDVAEGGPIEEAIRLDPAIGNTPLVFVTGGGTAGRTDPRWSGLPVARLLRPVLRGELLDAVLGLAGLPGGHVEPPAPPRAIAARSLRILVAEDNPVNRRLARSFLERRGHAVTTVDDGLAALDAIASGPFDLALFDIQMPILDGENAVRELRGIEARSGRGRLPVVALTSHAMKGDRERFIGAGFDEHIAKPLRPGELDSVVASLLGHAPPA